MAPKEVIIWPRRTDWIILSTLGVLVTVSVAGLALPEPFISESACSCYLPSGASLFDILLSAVLLGLVWSAFRLVRPVGWHPRWAIAEFIVVPVVWVGLLLGAAFWFDQLQMMWVFEQEF